MKMEDNMVLITGGATGIGLALAERFLRAGSQVIVVGRRQQALADARARLPGLHTRVADVARAEERTALAGWTTGTFPALNVLVNNAGVMRFPDLTAAPGWEALREELAIDLEAPIHLATLLYPHLARQPRAAIVNVTSGIAFVPFPQAPIYSAAKAGLSAFTASLRAQARGSSVEVVEYAPPHVQTDLGVPGGNQAGMPLSEFMEQSLAELTAGEHVVTVGYSKVAYHASRSEREALFERVSRPDFKPVDPPR
jgi:uncharacterized oxidoreductase